MSRYTETIETQNTEFTVAYGHDHAIGYFAQVYHASQDEPIVDQDEVFGKTTVMHDPDAELIAVATKLLDSVFADIRSGVKPTERMDRDPENHLGARLAAQMMPTSGSA